jgi:hypothetical protein
MDLSFLDSTSESNWSPQSDLYIKDHKLQNNRRKWIKNYSADVVEVINELFENDLTFDNQFYNGITMSLRNMTAFLENALYSNNGKMKIKNNIVSIFGPDEVREIRIPKPLSLDNPYIDALIL